MDSFHETMVHLVFQPLAALVVEAFGSSLTLVFYAWYLELWTGLNWPFPSSFRKSREQSVYIEYGRSRNILTRSVY